MRKRIQLAVGLALALLGTAACEGGTSVLDSSFPSRGTALPSTTGSWHLCDGSPQLVFSAGRVDARRFVRARVVQLAEKGWILARAVTSSFEWGGGTYVVLLLSVDDSGKWAVNKVGIYGESDAGACWINDIVGTVVIDNSGAGEIMCRVEIGVRDFPALQCESVVAIDPAEQSKALRDWMQTQPMSPLAR